MGIRIAHIADIHVRNLSRHSEYVEVFTAFVKQCKEQGVDHVFVGGDTFHTKCSGMSPECISFMSWMFSELASISEVHVMLGNHDFLQTNASRQDAISPIIDALANPRLHLYKNSGVYKIQNGYNLCIYSLVDPENWGSVAPVEGDYNIACYHGSVRGAQTEVGWSVEDGLNVDFFEAYDICLLGDIHKRQHLGYKEVELVIDEQDLKRYPQAEVIEE